MYWYIKYPLCLLCALVLLGLAFLLWSYLPDDLRGRTQSWMGRWHAEQTPRAKPAKPPAIPPAPSPQAPATPATVPQAVVPPRAPPPPPLPQQPALVTETKAKLEASGQQPAAAGTDAIEQRLATAVDQLQKEKLLAARALARKVLDDPACEAFGGVWLRAAELISQVNTALLSSDVPAPEKTAYIIQSGDTLVGIAQRHNTTVPALQRGNRLDPISPVIHAGAVLHIYRAQWELRILKERFLLLLLDGETLVKLYRVGTGRQDRTPVGVFRVATKQQEPVWTPAGRVIPFGDPRNVLGTRWLGLEPIEGTDVTLKGFGIHGTWEPETVGAAASEGCVRMHNEDVNELFDIVPLGARVVIEGE